MYDNGPRFAAMPKDVMEAIVTAAHKRGKMVIVHVFSPQGTLDVINAGVDGLAHVPIVKSSESEFAQALRSHHIFAITTLGFTDFFFGSGRLALCEALLWNSEPCEGRRQSNQGCPP
jgi:hypothetical protein